jgi:carbamoyl-phosphate synthase large subunit
VAARLSSLNVLITSCGAKVPLVRAFVEATHEQGFHTITADVDPFAPALYIADEGVLLPPSKAPEFEEAVRGLCQSRKVGLIVPTRDDELTVFERLRPALGESGTRVLVPSSGALRICLDKQLFVETCLDLGLPVPKVHSAATEPRYPVFVRPVVGAAGRGARIVRDSRDWSAIVGALSGLVVQEFVEDPEYSIDVLSDLAGRSRQAVSRLRLRVAAGEAVVSKIETVAPLIEAARTLCDRLGLIGHSIVQAFYSRESGVRLIEVNPRFGGASILSIRAGLDSPRRILKMLCAGEDPLEAVQGAVSEGLTLLRHPADIFIASGELLRRGPA